MFYVGLAIHRRRSAICVLNEKEFPDPDGSCTLSLIRRGRRCGLQESRRLF